MVIKNCDQIPVIICSKSTQSKGWARDSKSDFNLKPNLLEDLLELHRLPDDLTVIRLFCDENEEKNELGLSRWSGPVTQELVLGFGPRKGCQWKLYLIYTQNDIWFIITKYSI